MICFIPFLPTSLFSFVFLPPPFYSCSLFLVLLLPLVLLPLVIFLIFVFFFFSFVILFFFRQGLAFATVAGIPLLYGLYIVWAPPFFYSLYGVSLHVSYGPFALVGLFMNDALHKRGYKPCDGLCRNESQATQVSKA